MQENEFIYYLSGFLQGNGLQEISEENFINLKDKLDSVQNKGTFCLWLDGCFAFNNTKYIKEENVSIIYDKLNDILKNKNIQDSKAITEKQRLINSLQKKSSLLNNDDDLKMLC